MEKAYAMFQTLDEQVDTTEGGPRTASARLARFAVVTVILAVLFAALYLAIVSFE